MSGSSVEFLSNVVVGGVSMQPLSGCGASLAMQELISKYIVLENYFMSESLSKVGGVP